MGQKPNISRENQIKRGRKLEYFAIIHNSLEGLISSIAGLIAGSVLLIGFGIDSVIEATSGAALLWRLNREFSPVRRDSAEPAPVRMFGFCFVALAIYVLVDCSYLDE